MCTKQRVFIPTRLAILLFIAICGSLAAQEKQLEGRVTDMKGEPVAGAEIHCENRVAVTDSEGRYVLSGAFADDVNVTILYFGANLLDRKVRLCNQTNCVQNFELEVEPGLNQGLVVTATRTARMDATIMPEQMIRRMPAPVTGELLRVIPGVDSVRRGPVGLDPVVRGLRESEVGQYYDGARIFPAGPGRMDSSLSHIDPSVINRVQVVKGPYALTWGAGNLSAIRVESFSLDHLSSSGLHGTLMGGYQDNSEATHATASVYGKQGRFSYWLHGVDRQGDDYETGGGELVPADFESYEVRGKFKIDFGPKTALTLTSGYQDQQDIDYPGRLLDAEFFETENYSAALKVTDLNDAVHALEVMFYANSVDHGMNNNNKPTAQPNPNRMPPFPLRVLVDSSSEVFGGKASLDLSGELWNAKAGMDFFHNSKDATRFISRRDTGMQMFQDKMWPDATISDLGIYGQASRIMNNAFELSTTLRLDVVEAKAGTVSDFYLENVGNPEDQSESNLSGAVTLDWELNSNWALSFGLGSAVRTADATERYSDRIPSSKAQISAEFMGNPNLEPERGNQADIWLDGNYEHFSIHANVFTRKVEDYITLEATDLPRRLPLSPPTVYRYVNGEAEFQGLDLSLGLVPADGWTLRLSSAWLEGDDTSLDEPAIGISPFQSDLFVRFDPGRNWSILGSIHYSGEQDDVSVSRNEGPTDDYTVADLNVETFFGGLTLQLGASNLFDEDYVNHLNARNPFTGRQVPEPGRKLHFTARYRF